MEVPVGFEPTIIELQSIALPAWLRNHISVCIILNLSNLFKGFHKKTYFYTIYYSLRKKEITK